MANLFLASEIMEMSIIEERNGAAFYAALADATSNEKLREAAAAIAAQEKMHELRFTKMHEQLEQSEPSESYPGEYDAYIQSLLRNKMFSDEEDAISSASNMNEKEAIEFALRTEQAALNLYHELQKHIDQRDLDAIQETITEEENHVTQLQELLHQIS
ncbi:hypothetical protein JXO59_06855 [candidate division KSB1 bacterium]|nr:hypothetical protein [candidate division KSB1 bacterium]